MSDEPGDRAYDSRRPGDDQRGREERPADEPRTGETPDRAPAPPAAGADLVREALDRARADAAARRAEGVRSDRQSASADARDRRRRGRQRRPDATGGDPLAFGAAVSRLVEDRGWQRELSAGTVLGSWAAVVGEDIAARAEPVSLVDGTLTLQAQSTAWATQLRLLAPQLLERVHASAGGAQVRRLVVRGPTGPSWRRGPRSVRGEGPRDTYG